jgi:hypothetical protein
MLQSILSDRELHYLVFVGSYRDNEVDCKHIRVPLDERDKNDSSAMHMTIGRYTVELVGLSTRRRRDRSLAKRAVVIRQLLSPLRTFLTRQPSF